MMSIELCKCTVLDTCFGRDGWETIEVCGNTYNSYEHCELCHGMGVMVKNEDPYAELKKAHAAGKTIQYLSHNDGCWNDCAFGIPSWSSKYEYRIKPEPEYWSKPEHVPVGAIWKEKGDTAMPGFISISRAIELLNLHKGLEGIVWCWPHEQFHNKWRDCTVESLEDKANKEAD